MAFHPRPLTEAEALAEAARAPPNPPTVPQSTNVTDEEADDLNNPHLRHIDHMCRPYRERIRDLTMLIIAHRESAPLSLQEPAAYEKCCVCRKPPDRATRSPAILHNNPASLKAICTFKITHRYPWLLTEEALRLRFPKIVLKELDELRKVHQRLLCLHDRRTQIRRLQICIEVCQFIASLLFFSSLYWTFAILVHWPNATSPEWHH